MRGPVTEEKLRALAKAWHGDMVKGVADIVLGKIALGGEWHKEIADVLINEGSDLRNLWGFSIYPDRQGEAVIEYDSQINIRPLQGNFERYIGDDHIRASIRRLVALTIPTLGL